MMKENKNIKIVNFNVQQRLNQLK